MLQRKNEMNREKYEFAYRGIKEESSLHFYFSGREDCEPGHSFGPAVRNQYLLHFVTRGKGIYRVRDIEYEVKPGEVFLIYPGDITVYRADYDDPWTYRWMAFHGNEAETIMKRCGFTRECPVIDYAQGDAERKERVDTLLLELIRRTAGKMQGEYGLKGYLYLIFEELLRSESPEADWGRQYVQKAKEYIAQNFSYDIKIKDVAAYVGVDRTYLYRLFVEYQGQAPYDYLLNLRFQEARNMLSFTDMSVTLIACSCGFKDSSAFCRHFRKAYGKSPLAYRREQSEKGEI